jgi:hypothetical protein
MSDREAQFAELARKTIVYRIPGMDEVAVQPDETYRMTDEGSLQLDIHLPPGRASRTPPVAVIVIGYPDPQGLFRRFGWHLSWAQLLAASGIAAVIYGTRQPTADIDAVLNYLRAHAERLGVDAARIGLLTCSGHGPVAMSALIQDSTLACAALLYSFTMDLGGPGPVAEAAQRYGCVDACAGRSIADLPAQLPLLIVRAGNDQTAGLNDGLDRLIAASLARNLPLTVVNHHRGVHAFDLDEDSDAARRVIRQVVAFLCDHLEVR